jgi:hypothetical protein
MCKNIPNFYVKVQKDDNEKEHIVLDKEFMLKFLKINRSNTLKYVNGKLHQFSLIESTKHAHDPLYFLKLFLNNYIYT